MNSRPQRGLNFKKTLIYLSMISLSLRIFSPLPYKIQNKLTYVYLIKLNMIYQKIKSRLFNNNMLGTLLWSFYSSDKSSCKSASIMMIFVIQETTQNYLRIVFVSILICIIIIPTRRWVGHSGLNPKKSAIFLKGCRTFCHIFLLLEHWVGPLSQLHFTCCYKNALHSSSTCPIHVLFCPKKILS